MNIAGRIEQRADTRRAVVRCLGRFRLQDSSGNQLQIRTRKARALLAALALSGRPMTRDALADLLWSDRGETQARSSLRQTLFELQHLGVEEPVLAAGRDDVAIRRELLTTDLELIRGAASAGDWGRLLSLLQDSAAGLLTDLDGLDEQFDSWLRVERPHEPARTLSAAVDAAERCIGEAGPRVAMDIVSEVLRLDLLNEEATRAAMRIDHQLGDSAALHRHYAMLRERLREDYGAEPSQETVELFERLSNGNGKRIAPIETPSADPGGDAALPAKRWKWWAVAAVAVAVFAILLVAYLDRRQSPVGPEQTLVAVLPFKEQPAGDRFLADGLGEQTRLALSRNASLRVLGRVTTDAVAGTRLSPDQYRKRFGVTHLLEGMVRRSGDTVLVSVSLTRTSDGVAVWQDQFRGRLREPLALQDAIASGIEGKLRGRLAPQGGRRAEQISTTPEVYALYSRARQLISTRKRENFRRALALLRQAIALDPNYGPAWSLLGGAIYFNSRIAIVDAQARAEAIASVKHGLSLAPNFAPAYATLALIEGEQSAAAEPQLRRAVALDPNYTEAWNWLGNSLASQYRSREAIGAYERATSLDPLFVPAAYNLLTNATDLRDQATADRAIRRIAVAGARPEVIGSMREYRLYSGGDYSGAIKLLGKLGLDAQGHPDPVLWGNWFNALTAIGHYDALHRVTGCPEWYAPLVAGRALPPKTFQGKPVSPEEFWTSLFFSTPASRTMINLGQTKELVRLYRAGFRDADDFISRTERANLLDELVPSVAVALSSEGEKDEALYILSASSLRLERALNSGRTRYATARLGTIRAAQGDRIRALALLEEALRLGWLPDGRSVALDLAQEPAFRGLRSDRRFEAMRKQILDHIARERAELGPLKV